MRSGLHDHDPRRVGPFGLRHRLGAGGTGVVYLGVDDRHTAGAVKLAHEHIASSVDARARFRREIELTGSITAPEAPRLLGHGEFAGRPYLVTEYLPGDTLADRGPLPRPEVLAVAATLARALITLHARGLVHRDIKPGNVILTPDGARIIDFGIASAAGPADTVTDSGVIVGTAGWMAPEIIRGKPATPASDVFAWGLLISYAATGAHPFGDPPPDTDDVLELACRVVRGRPILDPLPADLRRVVAATLNPDPTRRPTAEALLRQVERLPVAALSPAPASTLRARPARALAQLRPVLRRMPVALRATVAATGVAALAALGMVFVDSAPPPAPRPSDYHGAAVHEVLSPGVPAPAPPAAQSAASGDSDDSAGKGEKRAKSGNRGKK